MGKRTAWDRLNIKDKLVLVESLARDGLTEEQIAQQLGVSRKTLNKWKKEHPEFDEALVRGKAVPDANVENALLKNALGFYYYEDTVINTGKGKQEVVTLKKYQPPQTTAQIFWLKNRRPDKWRDKVIQEHEGKVNHEIIVEWGGSGGEGERR
jgi:transposase-like protein